MKQNSKAQKSKLKSSTEAERASNKPNGYSTPDSGYSALAAAVIRNAIDDYETILVHNMKLRLEQEKLEKAGKPRTMTEQQIHSARYPSKDDSEASLERFFRSPDFQMFVGAVSASLDLSGEDVIRFASRRARNHFERKQKAMQERKVAHENANRKG